MVKADSKHTVHVNTKVIITEVPVAAMVNNGSTHEHSSCEYTHPGYTKHQANATNITVTHPANRYPKNVCTCVWQIEQEWNQSPITWLSLQ